MPNVLMIDNQGLYRRGLRIALEAALPNVSVFEANTKDAAMKLLDSKPCKDIALFDLCIPGLDSPDKLRHLRERYKSTRMVVLSASTNRDDVVGTLAVGINGFISKLQSESEIVEAVQEVLRGRIYLTPLLTGSAAFPLGPAQNTHGDESEANAIRLTPRQRQILPLLASGLSNKEIARELSIAEATSKIHVAALVCRLGARNRIEVALMAKSLVVED